MRKQDAITLLKADHAAVKKLFAQEEKATNHDDKKQSIFYQIKDAPQSTRLSKRKSSIPPSRRPDPNTSRTKCAKGTRSTSR